MNKEELENKLKSEDLKEGHNKFEWPKELDSVLYESVLKHCFNFDLVSIDVNKEAQTKNMQNGASNIYSTEKCRMRWSYRHIKVGKRK
jgi:hypothetical protein